MADMYMDGKLEERKTLTDVFLEYRHYYLEKELSNISDKPEEEDMEEVESDDEFITVNLSNKYSKNDIDEEFKEDE